MILSALSGIVLEKCYISSKLLCVFVNLFNTVDCSYNKLIETREICCLNNKSLLYQGYGNNTIHRKSEIRDCPMLPSYIMKVCYRPYAWLMSSCHHVGGRSHCLWSAAGSSLTLHLHIIVCPPREDAVRLWCHMQLCIRSISVLITTRVHYISNWIADFHYSPCSRSKWVGVGLCCNASIIIIVFHLTF